MKRLTAICSLALLLSLLLAGAQRAFAADAAHGQAIYNNWCFGCHGPPQNNKNGILGGANNSNFILFAWSTFPDMQFLLTTLTIPQDADDVAAYLGTVVGGTPGNLQVPGSINLGHQIVGTQGAATTLTITNTGGSGVAISSVTDSNSAEFPIVSNSCSGTIAANASCQISLAFRPSITGGRSATITITSNGTGSPQSIVASGTGDPVGPSPGQLQVPSAISFGTQSVGVQTVPSTATLTNIGGTSVTISSVSSSNASEFPITSSSCSGSVGPGASCQLSVAFKPAASGGRSATITIVSTGAGSPQTLAVSGTGASSSGQTATVVEYYNANLDHYFISALQPDITALDSGTIPGWTRTGYTFKAWLTAALAPLSASPVCRFYIPPQHGNSHFYSASPAECGLILEYSTNPFDPKYPLYNGFVYESPNVMYILLPDATTGACAAGSQPVYRLYNNRPDTNHRYTTDITVKNLMISKGYVPEGYGPNAVIMCAPL